MPTPALIHLLAAEHPGFPYSQDFAHEAHTQPSGEGVQRRGEQPRCQQAQGQVPSKTATKEGKPSLYGPECSQLILHLLGHSVLPVILL